MYEYLTNSNSSRNLFQAQKRELDAIRTAYRKTSLARSPGSPNAAAASAAGATGNTGPFVFVSSETGGGPGAGGLGGSDDEDEVGHFVRLLQGDSGGRVPGLG